MNLVLQSDWHFHALFHAVMTSRMWGYPYTSILGALLMGAILLTTAFTEEFRMTLVYGLPMLGLLTLAWRLRGNA